MKKNQIICFFAAACLLTACGSQTAPPPITPTETSTDSSAAIEAADESLPLPDQTNENPQTSYEAENVQQADLPDDSIGPVSFMPNEKGYSMVYGDSTLHAYFMRQNVIPGAGKMTIKKLSDHSVVETIDLQQESSCTIGEQDSMFYLLGWDGGTHLIIHLKDMPVTGELYYVNLEEGAFTSKDQTILSKEISNTETWCYGIADYGIKPEVPNGSAVYVGDEFSADILIRQPASYAKIENFDENRVRFNEKEFEKDGQLEIHIYQIGEDAFTLTFYNEDDDPIGSIRMSYTASMPPEPEQEIPQKTITNL